MTFEELFQLKEFKEGRLLSGEDLLDREIQGGHVIEMPDGTNWAEQGSLIFTSGVGFKEPEKELKQLIQSIATKDVAGLVVEIGPFIQQVSKEVIALSKQKQIPIFALPYSVSVAEIISKIYYYVYREHTSRETMEQILREAIYEPSEKIFEKMKDYGFDEKREHIILYFSIKQSVFSNHFIYSLQRAFTDQKVLWMLKGQQNLILIYQLPTVTKNLPTVIEEKYQKIQKYDRNTEFRIGVGSSFFKLEEINESLKLAKKACDITTERQPIILYEELGIVQLFFEITDRKILENMVQQQLGKLIQYDQENEGELLPTLQVYLESDGNITKTTQSMYVHRNTIKYRIKRIGEILKKDLQDPQIKFHLQLAFKMIDYLKEKQ